MLNYPTPPIDTLKFLFTCRTNQHGNLHFYFLFYVCLTLENILVVFSEILLREMLVNLKTSLRMKRFAEKLFVLNKVIFIIFLFFNMSY